MTLGYVVRRCSYKMERGIVMIVNNIILHTLKLAERVNLKCYKKGNGKWYMMKVLANVIVVIIFQ